MIKTSHKALISYACACLVLLTACQSAETISPLPSSRIVLAAADLPRLMPDEVLFARDITVEPYVKRPFQVALTKGELVLINNCVGIKGSDRGAGVRPVIWPPEYKMEVDDFKLTIRDLKTDEIVARLGDQISIGGGTQHTPQRLQQIQEVVSPVCFALHSEETPFLFATPTLQVETAVLDSPCIGPTIHWAPFLKLNDIRYAGYRKGPAIDKSMLGNEVAQVDFMVNCHTNIDYKSQNGDAAFMPIGTPIYAIKGVDPALQLAAVQEGRLTLFEADPSPTP